MSAVVSLGPRAKLGYGLGGRLVLAGLLAVNLLSLLLHAWAVMQWSWFQDDWLYVQRAASWPFIDYVLMNYNGHAMPLKFALVWLLTAVAPLEFAPAGTVLVLLIAASGVVWSGFLLRLFGPKPQVLVGVCILLLSPLLITSTLWWAAGMQTYSLQLGMGLTLWGCLEYLRSRRTVMFWLALGSFALAVLTWEKSLLILIPALFLLLVLPGVDRSTRATRMASMRLGAALTGVAVLLGALFLVITRNPVPGQADLSIPPLGEMSSFMFTAGSGLVLPGLAGGPWSGISGLTSVYPQPNYIVIWPLLALLVLVTAVGMVFRRLGWVAVLMAFVYAAAAWGLVVGSNRYRSLGEYSALDPRYSADVLPVVVLMLLYLVTATRQESGALSAWQYPLPGWTSRVAAWPLVGLSIVLAFSCLHTWAVMMGDLILVSPRSWVDNIKRSSQEVGAVSIVNSVAPPNVVAPAFYPEAGRISAILSPLEHPLSYDVPSAEMYVVDDRGEIRLSEVRPASVALPGPAGDCGYIVNGDQWTFVPMTEDLHAWNWGIQISYLSASPMTMEIRALDQTLVVSGPSGLGTLQGVLVSEIEVIALRTLNGVPVCVPSVLVGVVEPVERS